MPNSLLESDIPNEEIFDIVPLFLNFAGKINLNQSATLVKGARVVLTNDTGLMHIGAAFGKKILTFWGNTVPEFGMYPYQPHPNSLDSPIDTFRNDEDESQSHWPWGSALPRSEVH